MTARSRGVRVRPTAGQPRPTPLASRGPRIRGRGSRTRSRAQPLARRELLSVAGAGASRLRRRIVREEGISWESRRRSRWAGRSRVQRRRRWVSRLLVSRVSGSSESSSRVRYLAERRARRNSSRVVPPSTSPSPSSSRRVYSPPVPLWRSSPSVLFTSRLRPLVAAQQSTGTREPADRVHTGNQIVLAPFRVESELWFVWVFSPSDPVLPHQRDLGRYNGEHFWRY